MKQVARNITKFLALAACLTLLYSPVAAQGSIFGSVTNSDATVPDSSELRFFGFLDDTDEEIRVISSVGAGYDNGNWYDDFQNFLTEAAGNPYDYFFYNSSKSEGYVLSSLIPDNSFQEEDILLTPVSWPDIPVGIIAHVISASEVEVSWIYNPLTSYHVYRRDRPSEGSFFRIDDTTGSLVNPGVADSAYIDNMVDSGKVYDYMIIPEDGSGQLGPPSEVVTISVVIEPFLRGDVNVDGIVDVGDCVYLINYIFKYGPEPSPLESGESNCDDIIDVGDIVYLINYIFKYGPPPQCR
jgi:hypothetical protein